MANILFFTMFLIIAAIANTNAYSVPEILDNDGNVDEYLQETSFRTNNQYKNKQFADAIKECGRQLGFKLNKDQIERVRREISKQGYNYHEIVEACVDLLQ